jgi:hypothetical protein
LKHDVDKQFDSVDKRFDAVDDRFDRIEKLIRLEEQVNDFRDLLAIK